MRTTGLVARPGLRLALVAGVLLLLMFGVIVGHEPPAVTEVSGAAYVCDGPFESSADLSAVARSRCREKYTSLRLTLATLQVLLLSALIVSLRGQRR